MKRTVLALLYTAFGVLANPALADIGAAADLRAGDMKRLVVHSAPKDVVEGDFQTFEDAPVSLAEYQGKYVLVNFWATWCAPCRKEMPALSALQSELGGDAFEVVTIATGRNPKPAMQKFFGEIGVENLPLHRDPKQQLARKYAVLGLPVTLLLDPEGREVARLTGDADWGGADALAFLRAVLGEKAGG
ncbi:TlpA family protein disulfide reductase [Pseudoprimorskyibacter insulae]|uniref:Thiol:disulfide interchange protein TlpA n=1 Tax=Pseudoprimorskyibacter insulae TaxID=1695997 RepID=A0A2R8AUS8_9RHOB|nr:TlpA disulfide reductase family protein [Pseudoprimorskyibacter insulae]SPF79808.1 Thiol:disulfide interchange protein TlpA [Pseudoprimorskyibacter insulae]